ncbi:hypothetical protein [Sutcliffiella horikoshii]|uniref:hypothetical protein n=1 Tax=Sutcliffiella horikoshii TaxID=79883 RepID=UPI001F444BBC|nr:hypothetical protein [Sutcliffiella horikoshii]MCG1023289.1 hypothetical protein [Sutcliffiella horikoshii]
MDADMIVNHENMKVLKASRDTLGSHLQLEVTLPDGKCMIRWGLDEVDYINIKDIIKKNHFDSLNAEYHYEILPYISVSLDKPKGKQKFIASVRCVQGQKAAKIEFECSERFAGNMEWFRKEVRGLEDVESLRWGNFK